MHRLQGTRNAVRSLAADREALLPHEPDAHIEALRRLVERNAIAGRVAATHLPSHLGRFMILSVPELDDEGNGWIENEAYRLLGASLPRESLVIRHMPLGGEEHRVLIGCTRRASVESSLDLLRSAGLIPGAVYLDASIAGYAHVLEPGFVDGASWVYANDSVPALARYVDGTLHDVTELLSSDPAMSLVRMEMRAMGASADAAHLHVIGRAPASSAGDPDQVSVDIHAEAYAEGIARSVAVARWFGGLPRVDFIEPATAAEARVATEKRDALLFIRPTAVAVLVALAVLFVAEIYVDAQMNRLEAATRELRPLIANLEDERGAVSRLEARHASVGLALAGRSRLAGTLDAIGRGVPPATHLTSLLLEREGVAGPGEVWSARATGESADPQAVMGMLARMELDPALADVGLRHTSRIDAQPISGSSQIRFEIGYRICPLHLALGGEGAIMTTTAVVNDGTSSESGGELRVQLRGEVSSEVRTEVSRGGKP